MINIPNKVTPPLSKDTLGSLNKIISKPLGRSTVHSINLPKNTNYATGTNAFATTSNRNSQSIQRSENSVGHSQSVRSVNNSVAHPEPVVQKPADIAIPSLLHPLRKGQKTALTPQGQSITRLKACFGWNINDSRCDMDASAFLVAETGKVPGDEWFVFYGQVASPDSSVRFSNDSSNKDREIINVDFSRLNPAIKKIVFVITINEAFEQNLNFSMIRDAYIRLIDTGINQEIISYKLEEYYANVTSMTIGELYLHNGQWKFNPVGNGVHQDLAGQCAIYGVEIG